MKVTNGNNPYAYQQQANTKHGGFADTLKFSSLSVKLLKGALICK